MLSCSLCGIDNVTAVNRAAQLAADSPPPARAIVNIEITNRPPPLKHAFLDIFPAESAYYPCVTML